MSQELVTIKINEKEVQVPAGINVIEAAATIGIEIPHYCYHSRLSSPAVCRMCLIHVEGARKLQPACITEVREGLEVRTDTPEVKEAVRDVLELTLANHPLDCPICDQAGECGLQDYYEEVGLHNSNMTVSKVAKSDIVGVGPTLVHDADRCILCSRCVRFCKEITKTNELTITNRGDHAVVSAVKRVDNPYSTNIADICPVGAFTQKDFRFKCRVWYLKSVDSICAGCERGCNVVLDHYRGEIQRIRPRDNDDVNASWMCDHGRLLYKEVHSPNRITKPMIRKTTGLVEVSWEEAIDVATRLMREAGPTVIGQGSAHASNEDSYLFSSLLKLLKAPKFAALPEGLPGWEDVNGELLRRSDRTPNRKGSELFSDNEDFLKLMEERASVAVILQEDVLPDPKSFENMRGVIYLGSHHTATSDVATVVFPITTWAEYTGSFVNFQSRIQKFNRAVLPATGVQPAWKVFDWLIQALGGQSFDRVDVIFNAMAEEVNFFNGVTFSQLGTAGVVSASVSPSSETSVDKKTVTT